jgi:hypothetical protein
MKSQQIHLTTYARCGTTFFIKNSKLMLPPSILVTFSVNDKKERVFSDPNIKHISIIRNPADIIASCLTLEMMKMTGNTNRIEYRSLRYVDEIEKFYKSIQKNNSMAVIDFNDLVSKPKELFRYLAKDNGVEINDREIIKINPVPNVFFASAKEVESYEKVRDVVLNNIDLHTINKIYEELIDKKVLF